MNRKSKHARLLELGKDVLIVLLACSAVWLTTRVQRTGAWEICWRHAPRRGRARPRPPARWRWSARYGWRQWAGAERPPSLWGTV